MPKRRAQMARESLKNRGLGIFVNIEAFSGPRDPPRCRYYACQDDIMPSMPEYASPRPAPRPEPRGLPLLHPPRYGGLLTLLLLT